MKDNKLPVMSDEERDKKEFKNNLSYEDAKLLKEIFERTLPKKEGN